MSNLPPARHKFDVQAIQLRSYPFGEGDQIMVLFTLEYGLLRAVAKGARKPRSRLGGLMSSLRCNQLSLVRGRGLHRIDQADSLHSFPGIQTDYDRLMTGMAMAEMLAGFCQEEDPQPELYQALLFSLGALNISESPKHILLWFMLYLLENQGFYQDWIHCAACAQPFGSYDAAFWDLRVGGLHCQRCKPQLPEPRYLRAQQVASLRQLQNLSRPTELDLDGRLSNGLLWFLQQSIEHLLHKELKSFAFLYPVPAVASPSQEPQPPSNEPLQRGVST